MGDTNSIRAIGDIFGLSPRQAALVAGLIDKGGLQEAASQTGQTYASARNSLAEIKRKLGVATVGMLVGHVLDLLPDTAMTGSTRHDLYALSDRQLAIAHVMGTAASRREASRRLRLSEAVLDAELKQIHLILGIRSSADLARVIASAQHGFTGSANALSDLVEHALPTAHVDTCGRMIAYSDYGPPHGRPVVILHSTISARAPPTRLVNLLWQRGFRPIAIDRPGFGSTDPIAADDPYLAAATDVAAVCDHLGIARVDVIARGSGHAAVRLAQSQPSLVGAVVLVNPTPSITHTPVDRGPLGIVKQRFARNPARVEMMIRTLAHLATPVRLRNGMLRSYRDSPPDFALIDGDPQFLADYLRAVRDFAAGRIEGYVAEQTVWARGYDVAPVTDTQRWSIVQARHFILHQPDAAMAYWAERLPSIHIEWIEEAGQMLAYSHPEHVVRALERLTN